MTPTEGDLLVRWMSRDGLYRVWTARLDETVAEALRRHDPDPRSAQALARGLVAGLLAAETDPELYRFSAQFTSRGPLALLHVDALATGEVRGYVRPDASRVETGQGLPGWVRPGVVGVIRQDPEGRFVQATVPITTGEVDADLEAYLRGSEQVPSRLRVLLDLDEAGRPRAAAGVLVQTLPGGDPGRLGLTPEEDHEAPADPRPGVRPELLDRSLPATTSFERLLEAALPETEFGEVDRVRPRFRCQCSRDRVDQALRLLGAEDVAGMIARGEETSVSCDFCATTYEVRRSDLERILAGLVEAAGGEA